MPTMQQDAVAGQVLQRELPLLSNLGGYVASSFTTTAVNVWTNALGPVSVDFPNTKVLAKCALSAHFTHTVASAKFGCFIALYQNSDASGAGITLADAGGTGTGGLVLPVNPGDPYYLSCPGVGYPDGLGLVPPTVYLFIYVKNYTPGTLTAFSVPAFDSVDVQCYGRLK